VLKLAGAMGRGDDAGATNAGGAKVPESEGRGGGGAGTAAGDEGGWGADCGARAGGCPL
jgi:hypothetical protein